MIKELWKMYVSLPSKVIALCKNICIECKKKKTQASDGDRKCHSANHEYNAPRLSQASVQYKQGDQLDKLVLLIHVCSQ